MLRTQALSALFNENLDTTAQAIFLSTISGHLIGTSTPTSAIPPSLIKKAAILATSTFAYHTEQDIQSEGRIKQTGQSSDAVDENAPPPTARSTSTVSSGLTIAAYLSIQPLPLLAMQEWSNSRNPGGANDDEGGESSLRRITVEIPVSKFTTSDEHAGAKSIVMTVGRVCAVEGIGNGLVVGVLGGERRVEVRSADGGLDERDDGNGDDGEHGSERSEIVGDAAREDERLRRQIRLLNIRTEALAEFMREEFDGFRMPEVML